MYRNNVENTLIGLNQAWQSNANLESNIKENYPDYVLSSYKEIDNYIGFSNEDNIKRWFDGFLEKVYNVDISTNITDNLNPQTNDRSEPWKTGKDIDIVNQVDYTHGESLKQYPYDAKHPYIKRIFEEYVNYINYTIPELSKGKISNLALNDFNRYDAAVLNKFYSKNLQDFVLISPYIKIHRFFIASTTVAKDSHQNDSTFYNMVVYPRYEDQSFKELKIPERPWFKAAVENEFPLHYRTIDKNYSATFGLTGLYNDITTVTTTVLDRTVVCAFTVPNLNSNTKFIACLDLFFDNSAEFICPSPFTISRNANLGYTSIVSYMPFFGIPSLSLGYCSIIDSFFLFWILLGLLQVHIIKKYVVKGLEGILNQFNSEKYMYFRAERGLVHALTANNIQNPPKIKFETVTQTAKNKEFISERGGSINGNWKWFFFFFKKNYRDSESNAENETVTTTNELTLGIDNVNYYRRIEFWKIYNRSKTKLAGEFIVKWLNAIYTKEEIAIDLKGEFKSKLTDENRDKAIVYLKKEFETRLLGGEEDEFEIKVDLVQSNIRPLQIPYSIESIDFKGETILKYFTAKGHLYRFYEKKLFFRYRDTDKTELEFFLKLYDNMHIYSVCGITFLENLVKNEGLSTFIKTTGDKERLFIEASEKEFSDFISILDHDTQQSFEKLDPEKFRIYTFDATRVDLINKYKNYDFAIVKNDMGQTEYVLYHTPTSTITEIGWASWRTLDIDFYLAVYAAILSELYPSSIPIKDYFKTNK